MTYNDVIKKALNLYYNRGNYTYALGGQGESINDFESKLKYYYGLSSEQFRNKYADGLNLQVYDCSGFINDIAGLSRYYTTRMYGDAISETYTSPKNGKAGYLLWKKGHVGLDIGHGFFIHIPCLGSSFELGKISDYNWEMAGPIPGVDYTGSTNE